MDDPREHSDWGNEDNGSDSWTAQYESFLDQAAEVLGMSQDELRSDEGFNDDYEKAFGLEQGDHHLHDLTWSDSNSYAQFMREWLDYDDNDIDYWLGYGEDN